MCLIFITVHLRHFVIKICKFVLGHFHLGEELICIVAEAHNQLQLASLSLLYALILLSPLSLSRKLIPKFVYTRPLLLCLKCLWNKHNSDNVLSHKLVDVSKAYELSFPRFLLSSVLWVEEPIKTKPNLYVHGPLNTR